MFAPLCYFPSFLFLESGLKNHQSVLRSFQVILNLALVRMLSLLVHLSFRQIMLRLESKMQRGNETQKFIYGIYKIYKGSKGTRMGE